MYTNAQIYDTLIQSFESIFLHLLMQAIEVEEHFHVQRAYTTPRDLLYFKRNSTERFLAEGHLLGGGLNGYLFNSV